MDLRQIQYFVALYDERSVTRAARKLNVVQPALSMQIRRLEDEFGLKLFERTSRGVIPTTVARNLYQMCQRILAEVYETRRYLQEASGKVTGKITVGLMPSVAVSVLPDVLLQYSEMYPDVSLRILEAYSGTLMDWLFAGTLDFAVVNRMDKLSGVATRPLFRDHLVLVTARSIPWDPAGHYPACKLRDLKLVLPSKRQGMRNLIDTLLEAANIDLKPRIELDALGPTLDLVRKSDWATILPVAAVQRAVDAKQLRAHIIVEPMIPREVVVVHNSRRPPILAGELFITLLGEQLEHLLAGETAVSDAGLPGVREARPSNRPG